MAPLDGILVLDFSTLLPGPLATLLLADAGAEVIKIERPGGDDLRRWEPQLNGDSVQHAMLNRGKQIVTLDLKDLSSRNTLAPLLERADVLVEQFRPGVMTRLGLDYARLSVHHPRLIYCSITGYGQDGPKSGAVGHDLNYIAETGLLGLSMGTREHPVVPPALLADIAGGSYPAVINILLALKDRERTGRGCHLDISMSDNVFTFMYWAMGAGAVTGAWPRNGAEVVTGGSPRYRLYAAKDGRMIAVAALEDRFWRVFCDIIALDPALRHEASNAAATADAVARIIASEDAATWESRFTGKDCCCSVVRDLPEALQDPHFVHRGIGRDVLAVHSPICAGRGFTPRQ